MHGTTASSNIEKVWIGSKTLELWSRGRVLGTREKPEVYKTLSFPKVGVGMGISKKVYLL
jgi:hypothetical protein